MPYSDLDQLAINTIRVLAVDATFKANSGHPGAPMGMAPISHILFNKFMSFNPKNPDWVNRDRFVLSYVLLSQQGMREDTDRLGTATAACSNMPSSTCLVTPSPWMT